MPRRHALKRASSGLRRKYARVYDEEQRYLSGRRIPGIERVRFNGKSSFSSGLRCRPPRTELEAPEREFQAYKNRYLEENPIRVEKVVEAVRSRAFLKQPCPQPPSSAQRPGGLC